MSTTTTRSGLCWIWNFVPSAVVRVPPAVTMNGRSRSLATSNSARPRSQSDLARAVVIVTAISLPTSRCTIELSASVTSRCSSTRVAKTSAGERSSPSTLSRRDQPPGQRSGWRRARPEPPNAAQGNRGLTAGLISERAQLCDRSRAAGRSVAPSARHRHRRASDPGCCAASLEFLAVTPGAIRRMNPRIPAGRVIHDGFAGFTHEVHLAYDVAARLPPTFFMQTANARLMCFSTIFTEMPQCTAISGYVMRSHAAQQEDLSALRRQIFDGAHAAASRSCFAEISRSADGVSDTSSTASRLH